MGVFLFGDDIICNHEFITFENTKACIKCGMTVLSNNKIMFDKKIVNYKPKQKGGIK